MQVSGQCLCGAVRYRFTKKPGGAHVCHCRMCQKAFGSFFAPLTGVKADKADRSPVRALRCKACGRLELFA